ncbi:DUF5325 family protein [Sediminibacillus albus]|uniref:Uncharacterized protein n=1 Tax=Sediminibacillus albus TaxID=407036 RepID=A0A1G8WA36_9BACI|nr:DUF5325 family protein [Sediminibacillus albus]SDJ75151.1 hypothetical protein SAMN05216243_0654 [Sediminibacillus albus]
MKKIQYSKLFLAILVISCFVLVGVAIGFRNYWFTALFFVLGFILMGVGLTLKRKNRS